MPVLSRIQERILEAAAELFGDRGPDGVTFHQLARKARVTPGSIYRLFKTREMLFEQSVKRVLGRALSPADMLLMIFEGRKGRDQRTVLAAIARRWYDSLDRSAARLLMQATFVNHQWEGGEGPVEKIIQVLATGMDRELKRRNAAGPGNDIAARALILSLFQLKLSLPAAVPAKQQKEMMESVLRFWLDAVTGDP
jgi:AcrR family transcriptional regulator